MPEYLAPGVYVEETSFRAKSIEGVGTSTTAFVGPTRKGPVASATEPPELLTSFVDFERIYGGLADLRFGTADPGTDTIGFLAHAVRAYFNEGGARLYVARAYTARSVVDPIAQTAAGLAASANLATGAGNTLRFVARFHGACGNGVVRVRELEAPAPGAPAQGAAPVGSLIRTGTAAPFQFWVKVDAGFQEINATGNVGAVVAELANTLTNPTVLSLSVWTTDGDGAEMVADDLGYSPAHPRYVGDVLRAVPRRRAEQLENMYAIEIAGINAFALRAALTTAGTGGAEPRAETIGGATYLTLRTLGRERRRCADCRHRCGDGLERTRLRARTGYARPHRRHQHRRGARLHCIFDQYQRRNHAGADRPCRSAPRVSHRRARHAAGQTPGEARDAARRASTRTTRRSTTRGSSSPTRSRGRATRHSHARSRCRRRGSSAASTRATTSSAACTRRRPTRSCAARCASRSTSTSAQQEMLNPLGVNCLRLLSRTRLPRVGRAARLARIPSGSTSTIRRYFNYLEASIDRGTQWAVFEPNGERLWANVRQTISDFLYNEWRNGALLGTTTGGSVSSCAATAAR